MPRQQKPLLTSLDEKAADGVGVTMSVSEYRNVGVQLSIAASSTLTVKVMASNSEEAPIFSDAQSLTNHWDYIQTIDLQDGAAIDGDVGIAGGASADFRNLTINADNVRWINFEVSGWSAGSVTTKVRSVDNS